MQRLVVSAVISVFAFSMASAGPLNLTPPEQDFAQALPVQRVQAQSMGGGFLEMLFRPPAGQNGAPRYEPNPIVMPERYNPNDRYNSNDRYNPYERNNYRAGPSQEEPDYMQPSRPAANPRFMRQEVRYDGREKPGTVIINTNERLLYLVLDDGKAMRYGIGVGKPGFTWAGVHHITNKREWPDWRPPSEMLRRRPDLPRHMEGGPDNPLGARAMYLGSTLYRIHGSNEPWTIGQAVSSGCIRMRNDDVVDLYSKVKVGTKVVVI
jgi:lipoprotein-anchoring transpeptidase ErfK/SrfK